MKKMMNLVVLSVVLTAMSALAFAQGKSRSADFTFTEAVMVGETKLNPGQYRIKFNADKSELEIMRNGDLVATAKVTVSEELQKSPYHAVDKATTERGKVMTGVRFEGDRRSIKLGEMNAQTAAAEPQS